MGENGSTVPASAREPGSTGLGLAIDLRPDAAMPPFEQIRVRIRDAIASGELAAGAKLPTVRALAAELGVAVNTVARSYRELETDALIQTRGRLGSFVAASGSPAHRELQSAARAYADRAASLGVPADEALRLVAAALG
ncbi:GntR family transcriptional regulator [Herbiconiux sp.]|uniref:GntR family transcriptional regulator n=1 Tax=Herbiconiux sp. TaxID=1871186 RepID=UPI0025BCD4E5|nr:GntR family transcriptional regulator [Herbiconiux sp.]